MPTIDQYRAMLRIRKHCLDDELEIQAETQHDISSEVARLRTRALDLENELKLVEARLHADTKDRAEKMTADDIKAAVRRHEDRRKAFARWQDARELLEVWEGLLSSWVTKGYKLADLGGLYASDYFAVRTVSTRRDVSVPDDGARALLRRASEATATSRERNRL